MSLESVRYEPGKLEILDQTLLPTETKYVRIKNVEESWHAIKWLQVRGAPAIAIVGCLGLAVELRNYHSKDDKQTLRDFLFNKLDYLVTARPTAVHMKQASETVKALAAKLCGQNNCSFNDMKARILKELEMVHKDDLMMNKAMGLNGAIEIKNRVPGKATILTHCNAGALATGGYGTALGVIRSLNESDRLEHVYCMETRPVCQGSRLTAYELVHDNIPATLLCDSMAATAMQHKGINAVVIGADRVSSNGDTANKIGSYQLALLAKSFNIPFYVVCSVSTIDKSLKCGSEIPIEERSPDEITTIKGQRIAAPGINCWNPAFDVTPASLITGIVTENGVYPPSKLPLS